jgi:DNA-binding response OmpR family regulator
MRLLVVEDTEDLADALLRHLRGEGHAVDHVATAAEAAAAFRTTDYAAAVLDLGLPDGSGLDLLRAERARGNRTPILIATARDRISDRIAGLDAGRRGSGLTCAGRPRRGRPRSVSARCASIWRAGGFTGRTGRSG